MRCPRCGFEDSAVVDSRGDGSSIRRRRECESCHFRFNTFERVEYSFPMVVKKDGRREPFERMKIHAGLVRACEKTPVSMDQIDKTVEAIESKIVELCVKELPSRQIGDFLMEALKGLDKIAYIRFASVYREFTDISQFVDTLQSLNVLKPLAGSKKGGTKKGAAHKRAS
jgi:transcriptional repressor NrdR